MQIKTQQGKSSKQTKAVQCYTYTDKLLTDSVVSRVIGFKRQGCTYSYRLLTGCII